MVQHGEKDYSIEYNKMYIQYLFVEEIKKKKLTQILDLLFEIINIKDKFVLDRLYEIMGYPELILEKSKPINVKEKVSNIYNEYDDDDSDNDNNDYNKEDKKEIMQDNNENKDITFWPLFGGELLKKSENGEMYRYVNNIKIYETHCILAQLFPCSKKELYSNLEFIQEDQQLTEEERIKYIYKLLCISLTDEGNYVLFKYIYLTQSRFAIKSINILLNKK